VFCAVSALPTLQQGRGGGETLLSCLAELQNRFQLGLPGVRRGLRLELLNCEGP
jgi:hypothetical protein